MLEQHELVERVIPLHKEDTPWKSPTQILVTIIRIPSNSTLGATLCLRNFSCHAVLLGHKLLRDFSNGVNRDGEPVILLRVGMETH